MGRTQVAVGGNGAISLSSTDHLLKASTKSFDLIKLHIFFHEQYQLQQATKC